MAVIISVTEWYLNIRPAILCFQATLRIMMEKSKKHLIMTLCLLILSLINDLRGLPVLGKRIYLIVSRWLLMAVCKVVVDMLPFCSVVASTVFNVENSM